MVLELRDAPVGVESESRILRVHDLTEEYSVTQSAQTSEWVAVGTVRRDGERQHGPLWILVGVGISESHAIDDLQLELARAANR